MVLVVGATGSVGNEICKKLRRLGEPVRAFVRTMSSRQDRNPAGIRRRISTDTGE